MKLSDRMRPMFVLGGWDPSGELADDWLEGVKGLEAELADANARAMELTARCDRMRVERDAAVEDARVSENLVHFRGDYWRGAMAVVHFFDLARIQRFEDGIEYECFRIALAGVAKERDTFAKMFDEQGDRLADALNAIAEAGMCPYGCRESCCVYSRSEMATMHRRAQAAESRAIKAEREAATLRVRLQGAIAKIPPGDLWRMPDPVVDGYVPPKIADPECGACDDTGYTTFCDPCTRCDRANVGNGAPIPPVALEASDGGARMLDRGTCRSCANTGVNMDDEPCGCGQRPFVQRNAVLVEGPLPEFPRDEDLARRRVTEPPPVDVDALRRTTREIIQAKTAAIAERDARIAELTRDLAEVDMVLRIVGADRECRRMLLCANRDRTLAAERERDEAIARAELAENRLAVAAMLRERMETELAGVRKDAARATRLGEDLKIALRMPHTGSYIEWAKKVRASHDRADAADAKLAKVRELLTTRIDRDATAWMAVREALTLLQEGSDS